MPNPISFLLPLLVVGAVSLPATAAPAPAVAVEFTQSTGAEFIVTVDHGKQRYRFVTLVPDFESAQGGIARQRALSGWKDGFLFVRQQCGNAHEWRCMVDQGFTMVGDKLVHLGSVESSQCRERGCAYDAATGVFRDLFDGLQVNPVTGQVDTPPLVVARRVVNGQFVADAGLTWQWNQATYQAGLDCLSQVGREGFGKPCAGKAEAWSGLVFAAKLAHFTGRAKEWATLFEQYAVGYCAKSADPRCNFRVNGVKEHFALFAPGAGPRYIPSPVRVTTVDEQEPKALVKEALPAAKTIPLKL